MSARALCQIACLICYTAHGAALLTTVMEYPEKKGALLKEPSCLLHYDNL